MKKSLSILVLACLLVNNAHAEDKSAWQSTKDVTKETCDKVEGFLDEYFDRDDSIPQKGREEGRLVVQAAGSATFLWLTKSGKKVTIPVQSIVADKELLDSVLELDGTVKGLIENRKTLVDAAEEIKKKRTTAVSEFETAKKQIGSVEEAASKQRSASKVLQTAKTELDTAVQAINDLKPEAPNYAESIRQMGEKHKQAHAAYAKALEADRVATTNLAKIEKLATEASSLDRAYLEAAARQADASRKLAAGKLTALANIQKTGELPAGAIELIRGAEGSKGFLGTCWSASKWTTKKLLRALSFVAFVDAAYEGGKTVVGVKGPSLYDGGVVNYGVRVYNGEEKLHLPGELKDASHDATVDPATEADHK